VAAGGAHAAAIELQELTGRFQQQAIAPAYFYPRLMVLAGRSSVDVNTYPVLASFVTYLEAGRALQSHRIAPELAQLEWALTEQLAGSEDAKDLAKLSRHAHLLHDLFGLKLTPDQVTYYQQHRGEFAAEMFTDFLERCASSNGGTAGAGVEKLPHDLDAVLDAHLPLAERFYTLAHQRDRVLLENTLARVEKGTVPFVQMADGRRGGLSPSPTDGLVRPTTNDASRTTNDATRPEAVLLIAGGFHTDGITVLLRERQIPYVVITPAATGEFDEALYRRLVRGETADLSALIAVARQSGRGVSALMPPPLTSQKHAALKLVVVVLAFVAVGILARSVLAGTPDLAQLPHLDPAALGPLQQTVTALQTGQPVDLDMLQRLYVAQPDITHVVQNTGIGGHLLEPAQSMALSTLRSLPQKALAVVRQRFARAYLRNHLRQLSFAQPTIDQIQRRLTPEDTWRYLRSVAHGDLDLFALIANDGFLVLKDPNGRKVLLAFTLYFNAGDAMQRDTSQPALQSLLEGGASAFFDAHSII